MSSAWPLGDLSEDPADLEYGCCGIQRYARRGGGKLSRPVVSVEGAFQPCALERTGLPSNQGRRQVEESDVAVRGGLLTELGREIGAARIRRIALPKDREGIVFQLGGILAEVASLKR